MSVGSQLYSIHCSVFLFQYCGDFIIIPLWYNLKSWMVNGDNSSSSSITQDYFVYPGTIVFPNEI